MGIKEKMMDKMMGSMSVQEKKEMMDKMMDTFFSNMTKEEKQEMMSSMMPKMMEQMMGGMSGGNPMMNMMGSMMGKNSEAGDKSFNPMDMCKKMMSTISQSSEIATFATPEVRQLFEEWVHQVDEEILNLMKKDSSTNPDRIAEHLKISKNSTIYFLSRLAQKGKISISIDTTK